MQALPYVAAADLHNGRAIIICSNPRLKTAIKFEIPFIVGRDDGIELY